MRGVRLPVEVVVPLRWSGSSAPRLGPEGQARLDELVSYLDRLTLLADVTVVDGSDPLDVAVHSAALGEAARVLRPRGRGRNGKVVGALTGIAASRHELVVLADDDVRYDATSLQQVVAALDDHDLVRPQNVFTTWPWHARWDTGRSLLARAVGADWPGTFGLRASAVERMGGWDPEVLFENLEMVRTAQASGLRVSVRPDILVGRVPPSARHFFSQRLRQAYDNWAQPGRLAAELCIVPGIALLAYRWPPGLLVATLATLAAAHVGRSRYRRLPVPWEAPGWSLVWLLERGLLVWCAVVVRVRGGVRYHGQRVARAAHGSGHLRRLQRHRERVAATASSRSTRQPPDANHLGDRGIRVATAGYASETGLNQEAPDDGQRELGPLGRPGRRGAQRDGPRRCRRCL